MKDKDTMSNCSTLRVHLEIGKLGVESDCAGFWTTRENVAFCPLRKDTVEPMGDTDGSVIECLS